MDLTIQEAVEADAARHGARRRDRACSRSCILLLGGKPLIALLFGKEFLGAYAPLVMLMVVPFLGIFSFPLPPMLYALGRPDAPLKARLLGQRGLLRHHRALVAGSSA